MLFFIKSNNSRKPILFDLVIEWINLCINIFWKKMSDMRNPRDKEPKIREMYYEVKETLNNQSTTSSSSDPATNLVNTVPEEVGKRKEKFYEQNFYLWKDISKF